MFKSSLTILLIAAAALAGCDQSDHTIIADGPYDPQANLANNSAPVVMPPSITASHTYRCKDNSLAYIDWLSDGSARAKIDKDDRAVPIKVGEAGDPSLTGDAQAKTVTYNGKSCTR
ncbi:MAG: hypothetical protein ABI617_07695 [Sphingomicrobium sp.]